ncbi:MAG: hypothetical protein HFI38_06195 [Lachnospiraceae bacterium]|jgi:hypothetical protein|nr:hypothetical protein [Lachnospiraceae bacterium]
MKRRIAFLMALLMAVGLLGGCNSFSKFSDNSKDYGPYVKSLLDMAYKNDTTKYLELVDDTKTSADQTYEENMEYWGLYLGYSFEIETEYLNDSAINDRLTKLAKDIFAKAKYETADAVKTDDYYTVKVTIEPILFIDTAYDEAEAYVTDMVAKAENGDFGDLQNDENAYYDWEMEYAKGMLDILESYVDKIEYGTAISKIVEIEVDEDEMYGISDDSMIELQNALLQ